MKHLTSRAGACLLAAIALPISSAGVAAAGLANLRCEYRDNPLGIDAAQPRLSWMMAETEVRGQRQTAYQVLVASTEARLKFDQGDLWDSGKVVSRQSIQIEYGGQPLLARRPGTTISQAVPPAQENRAGTTLYFRPRLPSGQPEWQPHRRSCARSRLDRLCEECSLSHAGRHPPAPPR